VKNWFHHQKPLLSNSSCTDRYEKPVLPIGVEFYDVRDAAG
jgi:hypothetical protein